MYTGYLEWRRDGLWTPYVIPLVIQINLWRWTLYGWLYQWIYPYGFLGYTDERWSRYKRSRIISHFSMWLGDHVNDQCIDVNFSAAPHTLLTHDELNQCCFNAGPPSRLTLTLKYFYRPINHGDQIFFKFEIIINVLVSSFHSAQ